MNPGAFMIALPMLIAMGLIAWIASIPRRDVSHVDSLWSLFILASAVVSAIAVWPVTARGALVLVLAIAWALRLSIYITARNHGQGEDSRYQAIRDRNQPGFWFKSLFIVFGLQAVLAWIISAPLAASINSDSPLTMLDAAALALWVVGFFFEAVGDYQLSRFKRDPANDGKVLQSGLWRYTRHPNYFGEFCIWWAFFLFAVAAGAWWTVVSPILMSFLLLRVSGVTLLESTIGDRRPGYSEYQRKTNNFFPGPRRQLPEGI